MPYIIFCISIFNFMLHFLINFCSLFIFHEIILENISIPVIKKSEHFVFIMFMVTQQSFLICTMSFKKC